MCQLITIEGQDVEMVDSFKYLGIILHTSLNLNEHLNYIFKKTMQRLFLLRKWNGFDVSKVLRMVYANGKYIFLQTSHAAAGAHKNNV